MIITMVPKEHHRDADVVQRLHPAAVPAGPDDHAGQFIIQHVLSHSVYIIT